MNVLLPPQPSLFPHHHNTARLSPTSSSSPYANTNTMSHKRKVDEDDDLDISRANIRDGGGFDDNMSTSRLSSPSMSSRVIAPRSKRIRGNNVTGRPLALPRLLETLDAESLRTVLQSICDQHPQIGQEVVSTAPRPSVTSALGVLEQYQEKLRSAFPFGSNTTSDYAYNRVRVALTALIEALTDFTPHYLPPNETQTTTSLSFLDGATKVIHELPDWDSSSHRHHKDDAYDEIARAWTLVITEASKRGGGIQLHNGGWDQKVAKHNDQSGGRMQAAVNALGSNLGWIGGSSSMGTGDPNSIRNQLFSGTYGSNLPVHVGPW